MLILGDTDMNSIFMGFKKKKIKPNINLDTNLEGGRGKHPPCLSSLKIQRKHR